MGWVSGERDLWLILRLVRFGVEGFPTIEGLPVNFEGLPVQIPLVPAQIVAVPVWF